MSISKKVFGLALGAVLATNVGSVSAQQAVPADDDKAEELLFKFHDITPVENRELMTKILAQAETCILPFCGDKGSKATVS